MQHVLYPSDIQLIQAPNSHDSAVQAANLVGTWESMGHFQAKSAWIRRRWFPVVRDELMEGPVVLPLQDRGSVLSTCDFGNASSRAGEMKRALLVPLRRYGFGYGFGCLIALFGRMELTYIGY